MKLPTTALLATLLATGCSFSISGNHRVVGKLSGAIVDAQAIDAIQVENHAGKVAIRACEAPAASVEVEVLLTADRPATDYVRDFAKHVKLARSGPRLTVTNRHDSAVDHEDWQLRFVINVPTGMAITIHQAAGQVDIQLPSAKDVVVDSAAGSINITIAEITGKVTADNQAGEITLAVTKNGPTGGCYLNCTTGTVALTLPKGTNGMFDLHATTGDISVAKHYGLETKRSVTSESANGQVGSGGATFYAHTVTGTVRVR